MQDKRMQASENLSNPVSMSMPKSSSPHLPGNVIQEVQQVHELLPLGTVQKASSRNMRNKVSPDPSSQNECHALRWKCLLLGEESVSLGMELEKLENEMKAIEDYKLTLLDELVVLEGLIDPSALQSRRGLKLP